ncbi:hypothetical protein AB0C40_22990 [Streptomyces brevispora]|uniref:hypothetical protein n=1 Tax=Streptomyces brevispora TaxID=887462 RepID=UPI0034079932
MGIESDQLVYDYLSRVGDMAQQQQLSSGTRMRLVSELRGEIDRQRVKQAADTPAAVRRIIGKLGTPDELVAAAASSADGSVPLPQVPEQGPEEAAGIPWPRRPKLRKDSRGDGGRTGRKDSSGKGASEAPAEMSGASPGVSDGVPAGGGPSAPHRAGTDELGPSGSEPDWWRVEPGPFGEFGEGTEVPGFRGGVEIPALLRPPVAESASDEEPGEPGEEEYEDVEEAAAPSRRRWLPRPRRSRGVEGAASRGFSHPLLLLAAALLVTGAVMGSLLAMAGGWLLAYSSRKLSRAQAKWAALGLPGAVAVGALVWLWGRMDGRWGAPIGDGQMGPAIGQTWPWVLRGAAVASALYLVWRARRPRA